MPLLFHLCNKLSGNKLRYKESQCFGSVDVDFKFLIFPFFFSLQCVFSLRRSSRLHLSLARSHWSTLMQINLSTFLASPSTAWARLQTIMNAWEPTLAMCVIRVMSAAAEYMVNLSCCFKHIFFRFVQVSRESSRKFILTIRSFKIKLYSKASGRTRRNLLRLVCSTRRTIVFEGET